MTRGRIALLIVLLLGGVSLLGQSIFGPLFTVFPAGAYLNWTTPTGSAGYGIRESSGNIQLKNSGGSWSNIPTTSVTPGGSDTQIQFNDSTAFGGDSGLTFAKSSKTLSLIVPGLTSASTTARLLLQNTTAGTLAVPDQYSPALQFTSHSYDSGGMADHTYAWFVDNATSYPYPSLYFNYQIDSGAYTHGPIFSIFSGVSTIDTNGALFTDTIAGSSASLVTFTDNVVLATGKALQTATTNANTVLLNAYDVDNTTYRTFGTLTAGNTPSFTLQAPAGGTLNLGTPTTLTLTNATGLPVSTGISGLGTGVATALAVNTGSAGAFVVNGGALGTPSSGTLTSATGLPLSTGVTMNVGLFHVTQSNTVASSATPSINTDTTDEFTITALAAAITSMTTNLSGTPVNGQRLTIRILDNGTARAITWGASFVARGVALPTTTTLSKYLYVQFIYNSTAAVWDCVAVATEA